MSQPFTFPPPPPPPPKQLSNHNSHQPPNGRGGQRGRGSSTNFQQNSRGGNTRGQYPARGSQRGGYASRGHTVNQPGTGHSSYNRNAQGYQQNHSQDRLQDSTSNPAQKRPYSAAFNGQSTKHASNHRPSAPPAVPSFGINFDTLLPKKPEAPKPASVPAPRKTNLLGLTPAAQASDSESEDDREEEIKLATAFVDSNALQFEYRGETSALSTPEDIAKWITERRKKWPTEAKRETARKEAEERKKKAGAERAIRLEASRTAAKAKQEERLKQRNERERSIVRQKLLREQIQKANNKAKAGTSDTTQNPAQIKAEKLKRKAQKIAQQLKIAEEALAKQEQRESSIHKQDGDEDMADIDSLVAQVDRIAAAQQDPTHASTTDPDLNLSDVSTSSDSSSDPEPNTLADDTSTSGSSSESDSDTSPEQFSSKQAPPTMKSPRAAPTDSRPICTNFSKTGRCKFGRRCHFRHDKVDRKAFLAKESGVGSSGRRKGLYQVMVEKEKEEERKRALRVIIALGEAGVLDGDDGGGDDTGILEQEAK